MRGFTNLFYACSHCGGILEFPRVFEKKSVACYHCGLPTLLPAGTRSANLENGGAPQHSRRLVTASNTARRSGIEGPHRPSLPLARCVVNVLLFCAGVAFCLLCFVLTRP